MALNVTSRPQILISSSGDLKTLRGAIEQELRANLVGLSPGIFRWEVITEDGLWIEPGSPIQQQIDHLMGEDVTATIVMFGERVGEPLLGDPLEKTAGILDAWKAHGLRHPWPESEEERSRLLDDGCFPLTGTVYELLVALEQNKEHGKPLFIGYIADQYIDANTDFADLKLNDEAWYNQAAEGSANSDKRKIWKDTVYTPQCRAVVNLIQALQSHGTFPFRFPTEDDLKHRAARKISEQLRAFFHDVLSGSGFKRDLTHFSTQDPLPLPDRVELRAELVERFKQSMARGTVLALSGKSGCGKSSLLQKGLLGSDDLNIKNALPFAFRPTDVSARSGDTPFEKLCRLLRSFLEDSYILAPGLAEPKGGTLSSRIEAAVTSLVDAMEKYDRVLLLGVDQFEEILDLAAADTEAQRDKPESWWHVLRFIGRAVEENQRIGVAATLEFQRRSYPETLKLEERAGIRIEDISVEFNESDVRAFVERSAQDRGIQIDSRLIRDIEKMVYEYEEAKAKSHGGVVRASFLPLLSLWMHRFYNKFEDWKYKKRSGNNGETLSLGREYLGSSRPILRQDLADRQIALNLQNLVSELVRDAWIDAGQLEDAQEGYEVTDAEELNEFVGVVARRSEVWKRFVAKCFFQGRQNLNLFCQVLRDRGVDEVPGTKFIPAPQPDENTLDLFFGALVGVDPKGNMRLKDMPRQTDLTIQGRLIEAHLERRLLEPIADTNRVRLVHQAVVDYWPIAHDWFKDKKELLKIESDLEVYAHRAGTSVDYTEEAKNPETLEKVCTVLTHNRGKWIGDGLVDLDSEEQALRSFCLAVISAVHFGTTEVGAGLSDDDVVPVAYVAALYNLPEPMGRWLAGPSLLQRFLNFLFRRKEVSLVDYVSPKGSTLLHRACWSSPDVVRILLENGAKPRIDSDGWHPISAAIQTGNFDVIERLLPFFGGPEDSIFVNPKTDNDDRPYTMLHEAAKSDSTRSLEILLPKAKNADVIGLFGSTPLRAAVIAGRRENVQLLLEAGANCFQPDDNGYTALHWACTPDDPGIAKLFFRKLSDKEKYDLMLVGKGKEGRETNAVQFAAGMAAPEVLREILVQSEGQDISAEGSHPLLFALNAGRGGVSDPKADRISKCVTQLLHYSVATPADVLQKALLIAAEGQPDAFRIVLDHIVLHSEDLTDFPVELILDLALDTRDRRAQSVLSKRKGFLDCVLKNGKRVDREFLQGASITSIQYCMVRNIEPQRDTELFRLEAALRICRDGLVDNPVSSDRSGAAARLNELFPGVDPTRLHPVIMAILEDHNTTVHQVLLGSISSTQVRSLLHRLATKGELEAFEEVVRGLTLPLPLDIYDRVPSSLAPHARRKAFEEIEKSLQPERVH